MIERAKLVTYTNTDSQLAVWLNISQAGMVRYRKKNALPLEHLMAIAEKTNTSMDWLVFGVDSPANRLNSVHSNDLNLDERMLLLTWGALKEEQKQEIFQVMINMCSTIPAKVKQLL